MSKVTIDYLQGKKLRGEKITRVVLWDYPMARLADRAGVDMILVGDSLGMCVLGYPNTLPVTMDEMVHHCRAVTRGRERCMVVGDLPFMSYECSVQEAVRNAGRLVKEAGVDAIKLEGGTDVAEAARAICRAGIPVHGHIGLTPQKIKQLGGFRTQGKNLESAVKVFKDAVALAQAGCFAITVECVPPILGKILSERLKSVIIIGVGAGPDCDGQSVNLYDLIGLAQGVVPKFAKRYGSVGEIVERSIATYCQETTSGIYPDATHCYTIDDDANEAIRLALQAEALT